MMHLTDDVVRSFGIAKVHKVILLSNLRCAALGPFSGPY